MNTRRMWISLLIADLLLVVIFAALGRRTHAEGLDLPGILGTAAPFLVGLLVFSGIATVWREPNRLWPHGIIVWIGTVALGLTLRVVFGDTAAVPFIIVALIVLGVFLLGRRSLAGLLMRRKVGADRAVN